MLYKSYDNEEKRYRLIGLSRNAAAPEETMVHYQDVSTGEAWVMNAFYFFGSVFDEPYTQEGDPLDTCGCELARSRFVAVDG